MAVKKKARGNEVMISTADFSQAVKVQNPRNIYNIYSSEFSGLKPEMIHVYFDLSRKGLNFFKSLLFEEIRRRDLRIGGICQTRKLAVVNKEYEVTYAAESPVGQALREDILSFIKESFEEIKLINFISDCTEAQLQGVSTFEVNYAVDGKRYIADKIKYLPNHLLLYDDILDEYKYLDHTKCDARALRSLSYSALQDRIDLTGLTVGDIHPYKIIEVHSLDGNAQNGFLNGCIDSLIWAFLFKNYGLKDWSIYVERFASPMLVAKYPQFMGQTDKATLQRAVENYGNLFKLMIPKDAEFATLDTGKKSETKGLFSGYVNFWNTEISIRVLGQSLSTSTDGKGSYALGKVHNAVREDLVIADMLVAKDAVNTLIKRLVRLNFGDVEAPKFSFLQEKDIEFKKQRSEIFRNLHETGWRVKKENVEGEFGVEVDERVAASGAVELTEEEQREYIDNFIEDYFNFKGRK